MELARIEAAAARLAGQLVETPLIGGLLLPTLPAPTDLRIKPEVLQPAGSLYFRGAMHYVLRQLGAHKGLAIHGAARPVLAGATAAWLHRVPAVAFPIGEPDRQVWSQLRRLGCETRPRASAAEARQAAVALRREQGYHVVPGLEDPDYAAGIATLGLELARDLPSGAELVVVSPSELATPIAHGLAAAGMRVVVQGVDASAVEVPAELGAELLAATRLQVGEAALAALQWALAQGGGADRCVVLAE